MDLLVVGRESDGLPPTAQELTDPPAVKALLPQLPHGVQVAELLARQGLGVLVLGTRLDRAAARAAIGVAIQRSKPRGVVLLGHELGRELLGEGLPLAGGIRELHARPIGSLGQAKAADVERILADLCQRANLPWAPPSSRAAPARTVLRAEEVEARAAGFIERQQWAEAAALLRESEPLGPRGTNMLGRALVQLGDREAAHRAFERTLEADPGNAIAQRQIAGL